ncbi:hypothetical protein [Sutcliffiella sp. NC1]|uniref:hypothetical protein n=1 Tax=Sutcliffiella sp. NC1 TaxID=3004096 RepID=UPI0022DE49DD|nr:hypothetical protein [Sutcliffiella sp. NC1]WBL15221.1 hypothetical protein O1A01_00590 [Sutcliffiella sp. NC1]
MLLTMNKMEDTDVSMIQSVEFHKISKKEVMELFNKFLKRGTIRDCGFDDEIWYFSNPKGSFSLRFQLDELLFAVEAKKRDIDKFENLLYAFKTYLVYQLDSKGLDTIQGIYYSLKNVLLTTRYFNPSTKNSLFEVMSWVNYYHHVLEFIEFYPLLNVDEKYIEIIEILYEQNQIDREQKGNKRELGNFESVFKLGEIIDIFWENANSVEKETFFPIILWWRITTIIPLRTNELILTPYNCLKIENDNYFLTIRRTDQKGDNGKKVVTHTIEGDYRIEDISISKDLYDLILEYMQVVDHYDFVPNFYNQENSKTERRKFLFSNRSYFERVGNDGAKGAIIKRSYTQDFFTYGRLQNLLKSFYFKVVQNQFNYEVISKQQEDKEIKEYQIELLSLMDTRHHAFINMVLNDIEPLFVKRLGGHSSIESSMHYFSHVDKFVKCFTYSIARRLSDQGLFVNNTTELNNNNFNSDFRDKLYQNEIHSLKSVSGGKCSSQQSNDLEDCKVVNFKCKVGNCPHFYPDNKEEITKIVSENEKTVTREIEALRELVKTYKKVKDFKENYDQKVNKIKSYANQNALLMSKYNV